MSEYVGFPTSKVSDAQCLKMAQALREFGYPSVSRNEVRALVVILERGDTPDDVIGAFIKNWLDEADLLP